MSRQTGFLIAIVCGSFALAGQRLSPPVFHEHREAASDVEVTGRVKGVPLDGSRFVTREWIAGLPQVSVRLKQSDDFPELAKSGALLTGVYVDELARSLGAEASASAIEAICSDGYAATYSREYVRQHKPLFVLKVDGLSVHEWAVKNHLYDAEPYFISYRNFVPAFHVLSHKDQPLEPTNIVELRFGTEEEVYRAIAPKRIDGPNAIAVGEGYRIARQNCFRCHNAGDHGGTKAGKTWSTVGGDAKAKPEWFAAWVHDPQSMDAKAEMPPNKEYDRATLAALRRYFATFAVEGR